MSMRQAPCGSPQMTVGSVAEFTARMPGKSRISFEAFAGSKRVGPISALRQIQNLFLRNALVAQAGQWSQTPARDHPVDGTPGHSDEHCSFRRGIGQFFGKRSDRSSRLNEDDGICVISGFHARSIAQFRKPK